MRRIALVIFAFLLFGGVCLAQTPIDIQPVKKLEPTGSLATCEYRPIEREKSFFDKLAPLERTTGSFLKAYTIHHKLGTFVSWYGIVRGISPSQQGNGKYTLLLEHKYFDGMTDCHIMLVSQSGSGDFIADLEGDADSIPALALVRVYGKVVEEKGGLPRVAVEYMRVWPWFTFTFTGLGAEDHSNPRWAKFCKLCKGGRIYNPYPTENYYLSVLGKPKKFGLRLKN